MTREEMRQAVENGEWTEVVFWRGNLQSLVKIWRWKNDIILTWEEAPDGAQFDWNRYTRDWRRVFRTMDEVFTFLEEHSLAISTFELAKEGNP